MENLSAFVTITITILSVGFPILLNTISRLDEKYSSENIINIFKEEKELRYFYSALIIAVISLILWVLQLPPLPVLNPLLKYEMINKLISNSANYLAFVTNIVLVICFVKLIIKCLLFLNTKELIQHIISIHKKETEKESEKLKDMSFRAISDIHLFLIKNKQNDANKTIDRFILDTFHFERKSQISEEEVLYPELFYQVVYNAIEANLLYEHLNNSFSINPLRIIYAIFGYDHKHNLSNKTFEELWKIVLLLFQFDREDLLLSYWQIAHNFASINFYEDSQNRRNYIEFHIFFGSLLISQKKYILLTKILAFTQSKPASYELFPEKITVLIDYYTKIFDPYNTIKNRSLFSKFNFPEENGEQSIIEKYDNLTNYLIILFIKMINNFSFTNIGTDYEQKELREIKASADCLRNLCIKIEKVKNGEKFTNFNEFYETSKLSELSSKLDQIIENLDTIFTLNLREKSLSESRIREFHQKSSANIKKSIELISLFSNNDSISSDKDLFYITGAKTDMDREAFIDDSTISYSNADTILSENLSKDILRKFISMFFVKKTKSYHLEGIDFFRALDKLELTNEHVIISYNINIDYFVQKYNIKNLSHESFKNSKILNYKNVGYYPQSFLILKRNHLPTLRNIDVLTEKGKIINEEMKLYGNVTEINELKNGVPIVLLELEMKLAVGWQKDTEIVQLILFSKYREDGLLNKLSDVKPFK